MADKGREKVHAGIPGENQDSFCSGLPTNPVPGAGKVLVTGATGYVGGLLARELIRRGYDVRIEVMAAADEYRRIWRDCEVAEANALDLHELGRALAGIDTAFYLIHSMQQRPQEYEDTDRQAAENFRRAAETAGVRRIIYLGGLADIRSSPSSSIHQRRLVAEELRKGAVSVTVVRAPVIIGAGSYSFEILLGLARHLPLVLAPRWARNMCQPIAISDVIKYLVGALEVQETDGGDFEIGGGSVLSYEQMLLQLKEQLGLKARSVPFLISWIRPYAYFGSLLTPVPYASAYSSMQGLKSELVCRDKKIQTLIPFEPHTYRESLKLALTRQKERKVFTRWSDSYPPAHELAPRFHEFQERVTYSSGYSLISEKTATDLFNSVIRVGGDRGWFRDSWMWRARGIVDRLMEGVGTARGRKKVDELRVNDVIDFWRVEELEKDKRLLLRAEMKVPGNAWLEFSIDDYEGSRILAAMAYYQTHTIGGRAYWFLLLPFHRRIFRKLLEDIEAAA